MNTVLITPSYAPDYDRCRLLCHSVEKHVSGLDKHYLIVDRKDRELFQQLEKANTEVIVKEEILPGWIKKLPFSRKWWINYKGLPIRGWILQQLVKLSVAQWCCADNYLFADSDVVFIKPFSASQISKDGRIRLFKSARKKEDYKDKRHQNWYECSRQLMSITGEQYLHGDYIGQLNTWRHDVVVDFYQYLEKKFGKSWMALLANKLDFSEYILYGLFAEFVVGAKDSGHYIDSNELCFSSWHFDVKSHSDLKIFLEQVPAELSAVLVQSNLGFSVKDYQAII